ncbi:hypothetical protein GCM10028806_33320 [Spirosoma terrae]|uniref:Uncharacterized protein n=1 Tax=Spirosoma terrae TaxID=1968276 RepID=A0A6L9L844_9BACT|nr:hypothetical protein [Spirosoma terrae]NDU95647.1 hypothetical protein [Spirosoma terrae]
MVVGDISTCIRLDTTRKRAILMQDDTKKRISLGDEWSNDMRVSLPNDQQLRIYLAPDSYIGEAWKATIFPVEDGIALIYAGEDVPVEVIWPAQNDWPN